MAYLLVSGTICAQVSQGGMPLGLQPGFNPAAPLETVQLPSLDIPSALADDAKNPEYARFAAPVLADVSVLNAGNWTSLPQGGSVWHCAVQSKFALGIILLFEDFQLPAGARFFVYNAAGQTKGAYTSASCIPSGKFTIGIMQGDEAILEYYSPSGPVNDVTFRLSRVDVAYDKIDMNAPEDYGDSYPCNVNVNCPAGANYQTDKKGVARILMIFSNGAGWCTGSMIANTSMNADPYFLSANHCQLIGLQPSFDNWVFDFDYEAVGCNNPGSEPTPKSVLGCERIAYRTETDFMLLKLSPIPAGYGVYYNGWNRDGIAPPNTTFIHHPVGDIKKISRDTQPPTIFPLTLNWGGVFGISPANTHWKVLPDIGIYQPGSSGCPLLDDNHRIIGQLHGGSTNNIDPCIITGSYFGMFNLSWNAGATPDARLKDWLDPINQNNLTQNGYWQPAPSSVSISGNVQTHWGLAMTNVMVVLSGSATDTTYTDVAGNYIFDGLAAGGDYTITPLRNSNAQNGVTTFDLVLISKHLLGLEPLDSPWKIIACDANKSNSVTTFDIVEARKIILGINSNFPTNTSWRFFPADLTFADPNNPFSGTLLSESLTLGNLASTVNNINFRGVKISDTNNTANPGQ